MIRIGIVGSGTMGEVHAESFSRFEDVSLKTIYSLHPESAERIAKKYDAQYHALIEKRLQFDEVDAVVICTPTPTHADYALRALDAGKHVFLEKPIARTMEEAISIRELSSRSEGILMVGHVVRFVQEYVAAKNLLDQGAIGTVGVARTARRARFPTGITDWYADSKQSGGVILDMMIHDIDFLRWCFGPVREVYAKNLLNQSTHRTDFGLVLMRFDNGVIAHLESSWAFEGEFHYALEVAGREGLISFNSIQTSPLDVYLRQPTDKRPRVAVPRNPLKESPYFLEVKHFLECIRRGRKPSVGADEGCEALRMALAALESAKTGQPVHCSAYQTEVFR